MLVSVTDCPDWSFGRDVWVGSDVGVSSSVAVGATISEGEAVCVEAVVGDGGAMVGSAYRGVAGDMPQAARSRVRKMIVSFFIGMPPWQFISQSNRQCPNLD
jgi:hypothetical protein